MRDYQPSSYTRLRQRADGVEIRSEVLEALLDVAVAANAVYYEHHQSHLRDRLKEKLDALEKVQIDRETPFEVRQAERIWRKGCVYQGHSGAYCTKCGQIHNQTMSEAGIT